MTAAQLAQEMGVTESDVAGFVECLRLWIGKGYTFEQAIEKNLQQMTRMVNNAAKLAADPETRGALAGAVSDEVAA